MDFEKIYEKIEPKVRAIANSVNYYPSWLDKDDLFQEASLHLWRLWKEDGFGKNTDAYILQGGKFYLKNYIRCVNDGLQTLCLDETSNDRKNTFKDLLPDKTNVSQNIENKIFFEEMLNNGLTKKEKQVLFCMWRGFRYKKNGYTTREIGNLLGISHVRVIKIKENIKKKIEMDLRY